VKERSFHIADTLKTAFIDFVLTQFGEDVVIGHEIMYGSSGRIADLVILYKGDTYAIEVKSDSDSLSRIDGQIQDYQKLFNYVLVVCGEKYKRQLKQRLPKGVGLYQVGSDSAISEVCKPRRRSRLNKDEMLFCVKTSFLAQKADFSTTNIGADAIRTEFAKKRTSYVQEILYDYWSLKMRPAFDCFLSDRGSQTLPIDLSNFSSYRVSPAF